MRIPKLKRFDDIYLGAFDILDEQRRAGMSGPEPISIEAITSYLQLVEVDSVAERLKYVTLIQGMDRAVRTYWAEKAERNKNKK